MSRTNTKNIKFNDVSRIKFILVLLVVVLAVTFSIPTLARYKNYINLEAMFSEAETWDGTVATDYNSGNGNIDDPYIISNASELAFFAKMLETTDYAGTYFKLSNNIILNNGLFSYDEENIMYTLNDTMFYLDKYTGNAYDNKEFSGNIISSINIFNSIDNFAGYFDGDYYTIYGLYLTGNANELALFNNLNGTFENVYFKNSLVYGGSNTSVVANNLSGNMSNVSVDGYVIGTGSEYNTSLEFNLDDIEIIKDVDAYSTSLDLTNYTNYDFDSLTIMGTYTSTNSEQILTINDENVSVGDFELNIGNVTSLEFVVNDAEVSDITVSNLVLIGTYNYPITSGLVGISNNSNLTNVINKANVYGINVSGLIGVASDLSLNNAYNIGGLKGTNVSSIINRVSNNNSTVINKVYNNGDLNGTKINFIGDVINSNSVVVGNSFNTKVLTSTFGNVNGNFEVLNLYDVNNTSLVTGSLINDVNVVTREEINKTLLESIGYKEYVDNDYLVDNPDYEWVYEYEEVPVLYVDELNNPIASLNIGVYSWNDLGYELKTIEYSESKAFNITPLNGFNNFKNVYYYIHEGEDVLSKEEIKGLQDWIEYEDIVSLENEGKYIVYIKVVDQEDRNYYINSDILFFDLEGPSIKMSLGNDIWDSYNDNLSSKYISDTVTLSVDVTDMYSDVESTLYYVSDVFISKEDLTDVEWISYDNSITLDNKGTSVVYVKSTDSKGHITIINSDYIIYGGYEESLIVGNDIVENAYITSNSSVVYSFTYDENISYTDGYNSNLVLNSILPKDTLITLVDRKLNNVYNYVIDNEDIIIPLNKFSVVGNKDNVLFDEVAYIVSDKKDVSIIFDFSKCEVDTDFTFNAYLDLRDNLGNVVLSTLSDTIKDTKVYSNLESYLSITNKSVIYGINYDSNSKNLVEFEYSFNSLVKDNVVVRDTYYDGMKTGIAIKLVDDEGTIIDRKYLKNMEFIVDGNNYFANSDGIVRINMSDSLDKVSSSLTIVTHENDLDLSNGNYSLIIVPYVAYDGKYTDSYSNSNISIPVVSDYEEILDYEFNVDMDDSSKILVKDTGNVVIPFNIVSNNRFTDPSIRISLYKKESLTAYNQNYLLIDLDDYSSNELELATDYSYIINEGKYELNLDLSNLDKTGYEIRFELFDGDRRIDLIKKKFIVR